jgi:hypothetical protein
MYRIGEILATFGSSFVYSISLQKASFEMWEHHMAHFCRNRCPTPDGNRRHRQAATDYHQHRLIWLDGLHARHPSGVIPGEVLPSTGAHFPDNAVRLADPHTAHRIKSALNQ